MGIRGGGLQHQEYIMTFNEVLNTIAHNRYTYSFVMLYQRTRSGLEFKVVTPHAQRERGKVIGRGVHIYIYIYIYIYMSVVEKKI